MNCAAERWVKKLLKLCDITNNIIDLDPGFVDIILMSWYNRDIKKIL